MMDESIGSRIFGDRTVLGEIQNGNGATAGFDYLRFGLAVAVLVWHSIILTSGSLAVYRALWSGPFRFLVAAILPMFFALSGFLVTGSLVRTRLHQFAALRVLRLAPALAVEVTLSALVLGALFTNLPLRNYLTSPELGGYFGNILGLVHFTLPGVFEHNRVPRVVNSQLWTIPFELECYASLAIVSLLMGLRHRRIFVALLVLFSLVATAEAVLKNSVSPFAPLQGRVLVVAFLAGVAIHLYRDRIPYSPRYRRRRRHRVDGLAPKRQRRLSRRISGRLYDRLDRTHATAENSVRRPVLRCLLVPLPSRADDRASLSGHRVLVADDSRGFAADLALCLAVLEPD